MRVLVVGGGGREHTICQKLRESGRFLKLHCAPGNTGIAEVAELVPIDAMEFEKVRGFALWEKIDLVVIGMDDPLIGRLADFLEKVGLKVPGLKKNAAILEGSKAFARELMKKYEIPTAVYESLTDYGMTKRYLETCKIPVVPKADGPALGKGVLICETREAAEEGLKEMMLERKFGTSGDKVVIEEFMTGREVFVLSFVDGKTIRIMANAQDHKRAKDGDQGPNMGGMGNYSPSPYYTDEIARFCEEKIYQRAVDVMVVEGRPFQGVIFSGLMLTPDGSRVLEYNVRFGDPEAQVALPCMKSDLLEVMFAYVEGKLDEVQFKFCDKACITVVLANENCSAKYEKGLLISGLEGLKSEPDVYCYHAGMRFDDEGCVTTNGGQVLDVTALGKIICEARERVYAAVEKISFVNKYMRMDTALAGVAAEEAQQVRIIDKKK